MEYVNTGSAPDVKNGGDFGAILTASEKLGLGIRLTAAVMAGGLLLVSYAIEWFDPGQAEVAGFLNGIAALLAGIPVMWNAWKGLASPQLESVADLLVSVALLAAWVAGDLRSATIIPMIMVIGHILEDRSMIGSREAVNALSSLTESLAVRIGGDGREETVSSRSLCPGDMILIRPGEKIPADGVITEGRTSLDTAALTGESVPFNAEAGDFVQAGCLNLYGLIKVTVRHSGKDTALGQIVELLKDAEKSKPPVTRVLEQHAGSYLPLTVVASLITLFITGDVSVMMSVLVVSCPCALAISAPATTVAGLAAASRHGILVKGTAFLEQLAGADSMVFDKTGTLTTGNLEVTGIIPADGECPVRLKQVASALAAGSTHPVSRAVAGIAAGDECPAATSLTEAQGRGVAGDIDGVNCFLGRRSFLVENGIEPGVFPDHNGPVVACGGGTDFLGWILLEDCLRPEAGDALNELRRLGIRRMTMVTGDRREAAETIAGKIQIDAVYSEVLPEDKMAIIQKEVASGFHPVMVGDGINDALALKAGSAGVAMGGAGTDVALASSDIVLLSSDLGRLATMIRLSRRCRRTITANIAVALVWTLIMFVAAVSGFMGPVAASLLHNVGTLLVLANSGRLLKFDEGAKNV